jgi:glycerol-3-phosphate dehydrogenase
VPRTSDKRVLFAIPWHGHTLVGTTDTPIAEATLEPAPMEEEIEFLLSTSGQYLQRAPTRQDILSVFTGIRPLVKAGDGANTAALSRDHTIQIDESGLLNITGGKWTTYRHMAEDCVNHAATLGRLPERECRTRLLRIHGHMEELQALGRLSIYGSDAAAIEALARTEPKLAEALCAELPYNGAEVVWAVRHEMARTVEDVLARRTRALFLNAAAAKRTAPKVASLMAAEMGVGPDWVTAQLATFLHVASHFSANL